MVSGLQEIDPVVPDEIDEAMFLSEAAGPDAWSQIFERFRLADSGKGISHDRLDQGEGSQGCLAVGLNPVSQVVTEFRLENGLAMFTSPQDRCPCATCSRKRAPPRA